MRILKISSAYTDDIFDNESDDVEVDEFIREIADKIYKDTHPWEDIKQVSTSTCETIYDFDGEKIRLWVITGGTPAISFVDYSFMEKFPVAEKYTNNKWSKSKNRYIHQDPDNLQGPTAQEVLPEGLKTIYDYVIRHRPKKKQREDRYKDFPQHNAIKRKIKLPNGVFFQMIFSPRPSEIGISTPSSSEIVPKQTFWANLQKFKDSISRDGSHYISRDWEDLTEDQYLELRDIAASYVP